MFTNILQSLCFCNRHLNIHFERYFDFMNNFLNKLERKFGRYAIIGSYQICYSAVLCGSSHRHDKSRIYYSNYLCLDMSAVFRGQIWRLFTFLIEPYGFSSGMGMLLSILFFVIQVQLFFLFGRSLEQAWGTFRFNMYFLSGYLFNIIAALYIVYITAGTVRFIIRDFSISTGRCFLLLRH